MTPEQFAYWLQGYVELHGEEPTTAQWDSIKEHLSTVFIKVTNPVAPPNYLFKDGLSKNNLLGY
jgi:hypothetical protein